MAGWSEFSGINRGYVLELYERFRRDPRSVDPATRAVFEAWTPTDEPAPLAPAPTAGRDGAAPAQPALSAFVGLVNLADSIRRYGHLAAALDPLGAERPGDPALELATYGLTEDDLKTMPAEAVGGPAAEGAANAFEAIARLRAIYSGTTGYDFAHIFVPEERDWLREVVEAGTYRPPTDPIDDRALLERLTVVEAFE